MTSRNAHVVGAGIAGLALAACLAQRRWNVIVHERSSELREIGAGIGIKENSIRVMEELGCFGAILSRSHRIKYMFINDRPGHNLREISYGLERVYTVRRQDLHRELANSAKSWGADIKLNSNVLKVSPEGRIETSDGEYKADVIIGADGLGSLVRLQSGLGKSAKIMNSGSTRVLVPRKARDLPETSCEYWRGHKRILMMPMSDDTLYVCASSREDDKRGIALPFDVAYWSASFPELSDVFARIPSDAGTHFAHGEVRVRKWHIGHIAILGDAAHGQPPNLGQGAGIAIANARSLAEWLEKEGSVERAITRWEKECFDFSRQVQNWSVGWEYFMHCWPLALEPLRSKIVLGIARFPPTKRHWKNLYRGYRGSSN
jgi:2-polyprenyl-6-methoxyphenol hydroxylase-like FAD-dependent oxidoreductase